MKNCNSICIMKDVRVVTCLYGNRKVGGICMVYKDSE